MHLLTTVTLFSALLAACAGDGPPQPAAAAGPVTPPVPGRVRLAGTGAATPLLRTALEHLARAAGDTTWVLEQGIGSGGGIAAAADGEVDVGLVSRPLSGTESLLGLDVVTVATDAVVLAAHPAVPIPGLSSGEVRQLYAGHLRSWPDGSPATVLLRDRGESANGALERAIPGVLASRSAQPAFRVLFHDSALLEALAATPGAVGVTSLSLLKDSQARLKVLALDGGEPSAAFSEGAWPATRPISLVFRPERRAAVAPLLAWFSSPEGVEATRAAGYRPEVTP
jgi:phosphate transport system substrate-binding protein